MYRPTPTADLDGVLARLADRIRACEQSSHCRRPAGLSVLTTGWAEIDAALPYGGLPCAALHEWLGPSGVSPGPSAESSADGRSGSTAWRPALGLLAHLAWQAVHHPLLASRRVAWIGRAVRPYGRALVRAGHDGAALLERSLFVHPRNRGEQVWAIDVLLRSPAVAAVVVDASGLDHVAMRRFQLAAEAGGGVGLLVGPGEVRRPVFSTTRWRLERAVSIEGRQRWTLELLRCKGVQPKVGDPRHWMLERDHATGALLVSADLGHRSRPARRAAE